MAIVLLKRVARIEAIGVVDELNSIIGLLLTCEVDAMSSLLVSIQHRLFDLGGELSVPSMTILSETQVVDLESEIDDLNASLSAVEGIHPAGG